MTIISNEWWSQVFHQDPTVRILGGYSCLFWPHEGGLVCLDRCLC
jgi:hypothetical protein